MTQKWQIFEELTRLRELTKTLSWADWTTTDRFWLTTLEKRDHQAKEDVRHGRNLITWNTN